MERILHIPGGSMNYNNGIANFIMNVYRYIDRSKFQFDFLIYGTQIGEYEQEIQDLGGKVYHVPDRHANLIKNIIETFHVFKNDYRIIHRHTAVSMSFTDFWLARIAGIKIRICHSHGTACASNKLHRLCYPFFMNSMTHRLACGTAAGQWLYGKDLHFEVQRNGILTKKFAFNSNNREHLRSELQIADDILCVGNIGRLCPEKNQKFLLEIFTELLKLTPNSYLIVLGNGELEKELKEMAHELKIDKKVLFTGRVTDVERWLSAMDIVVYPSFYEGFPIAVLEGEAAGIPTIVSSGVPSEIDVLGNVVQINLEDTPDIWAHAILDLYKKNKSNDRTEAYNKIKAAGYDIIQTAKEMEAYYDSILPN